MSTLTPRGIVAELDKFVVGQEQAKRMDPATTLAPLSSQSAADLVRGKIAKAVAAGAKAQQVGPKVPVRGAFVQPTILTGVTDANPARLWEFFGPVSMSVKPADITHFTSCENRSTL